MRTEEVSLLKYQNVGNKKSWLVPVITTLMQRNNNVIFSFLCAYKHIIVKASIKCRGCLKLNVLVGVVQTSFCHLKCIIIYKLPVKRWAAQHKRLGSSKLQRRSISVGLERCLTESLTVNVGKTKWSSMIMTKRATWSPVFRLTRWDWTCRGAQLFK